jgi:peptide/nickel transport system permease protein
MADSSKESMGTAAAPVAPAPPTPTPTPTGAATDAVSTGAGTGGGAPAMVGVTVQEERISVATQRQLVWWRFRKHRLAAIGGVVVVLFYLLALGADFLAYSNPRASDTQRAYVPPQPIHWFEDGRLAPHVHPVVGERDPVTFQPYFTPDDTRSYPLKFFATGYEYSFLGIKSSLHLIGVEGQPAEESLFLFGTDQLGRDIFSRLCHATRISLLIGLAGVSLSILLGVVLGGISGFYGGAVDSVIQRAIEILQSMPVIPLWMGLAAAMPRDWEVLQVYFAITVIISLIGWTELARVVRGRLVQIRSEDFVTAAELVGSRPRRIIFVHMVPLFASHIIAATTLALPMMIIAETSLSFLGLGIRAPAISWGVMLQDAQNLQSIALAPWLFLPVAPVIVAILAFNFLGDGLRDAADPYGG